MEIYILDSLLRRDQVVDKFESLIWTERFSASGDFELTLQSTLESRSQFRNGVQLAINNSYRMMTIDSVEDSKDNDGRSVLKVKGTSLESIFNDRVVKNTLSNLTVEPKTVFTGMTPGAIARQMFNYICVLGSLNIGDKIPFFTPGTIFPADTIPESSELITWEQEPASLYDALKKLCDLYDLGFRLIRNFDTSQIYFNIYSGNDRTTQQNLVLPVIFAYNLDNLQDITELITSENSKNVAYVFSSKGFEVVYPDDVDPEIEGFERRVLLVSGADPEDTQNGDVSTPPTSEQVSAALIQQGKEELSKNRTTSMLDGELDQNSVYKYGVDYELGDLVEMRSIDGIISIKRVTEQIFVSDHEGERSYPTLTMKLYVTSNTWLSWPNDQVWEDLGLTEYWVDQ